jgi:hypothetical protein
MGADFHHRPPPPDEPLAGERPPAWRAERAVGPSLPLEARVWSTENGGWAIRLPVRAERVVFDTRVVVTDQVTICRGEVTEVVRVADTVDREVLRVDTVGDARVQYPSERRGGGWG